MLYARRGGLAVYVEGLCADAGSFQILGNIVERRRFDVRKVSGFEGTSMGTVWAPQALGCLFLGASFMFGLSEEPHAEKMCGLYPVLCSTHDFVTENLRFFVARGYRAAATRLKAATPAG